MKRYKVLGAAAMLGAIVGALGTLSIVHTGTLEDGQSNLPKPAVCSNVTAQDMVSDPVYSGDSALVEALSMLPQEMTFLRCHHR